jgi:hypothetical protein
MEGKVRKDCDEMKGCVLDQELKKGRITSSGLSSKGLG